MSSRRRMAKPGRKYVESNPSRLYYSMVGSILPTRNKVVELRSFARPVGCFSAFPASALYNAATCRGYRRHSHQQQAGSKWFGRRDGIPADHIKGANVVL